MTDGDSDWSREAHLLAAIVDALHAANWQRAQRKGAPRPKPIPRPGVSDNTKRYGNKARPLSEMRARLDAWREGHGD